MTRSLGPLATRAGYRLVLAFPVALFTTAVATDIAYLRTAEVQWTNMSAWAIATGVAFGAAALLMALIGVLLRLRAPRRGARGAHTAALAIMCVLGLINAFKHSQDGWSSVGALGLTLSILTGLCALVAAALAYSDAVDSGDA